MTQVNPKPPNTPLRFTRKPQNKKKQKESKKTKTSHQAQNRKQRKFLFFHDLQQLPINRQNCKSKPPKPAPLLQNNHRTTYHTTIDYLKAYHFLQQKKNLHLSSMMQTRCRFIYMPKRFSSYQCSRYHTASPKHFPQK